MPLEGMEAGQMGHNTGHGLSESPSPNPLPNPGDRANLYCTNTARDREFGNSTATNRDSILHKKE